LLYETRQVPIAWLLVVVGWLNGSPAVAAQPDRSGSEQPVATARRTTETIHADGRLDEIAWQSAEPIG
jgi:hypothetical protein